MPVRFCIEVWYIFSDRWGHGHGCSVSSRGKNGSFPHGSGTIIKDETQNHRFIILFSYYIKTVISVFSGVYEHIRNRASLSDTYPYFDATSERNVTSFVGQVTHLHCTVRDIGDRTVSKTKQKCINTFLFCVFLYYKNM